MKIQIDDNIIKHYLQNVYFINGHSFSGKSTMVKMLSERYNMMFCGEKYSGDRCHCMDVSMPTSKTEEFDYTIGFLYNGAKNEDGLDIVTVHGGSYAIFTIPEKYKNDIGEFMARVITETLPATGHELAGVDVEYFSETKMEAWFLVK